MLPWITCVQMYSIYTCIDTTCTWCIIMIHMLHTFHSKDFPYFSVFVYTTHTCIAKCLFIAVTYNLENLCQISVFWFRLLLTSKQNLWTKKTARAVSIYCYHAKDTTRLVYKNKNLNRSNEHVHRVINCRVTWSFKF